MIVVGPIAASGKRRYDGRLAILVDPSTPDGRGRGLMVCAAADTTTAMACTMAIEGRSILSLAMDEAIAFRLQIKPMVNVVPDSEIPYFISMIEAASCRETGISAEERALTMRTAGSPTAVAQDLVQPGHIMPMVVPNPFRRNAQLVDLAYLLVFLGTGHRVAGWCDILDDAGEVASASFCADLAERLGLPVFTADEVRELANGPFAAAGPFLMDAKTVKRTVKLEEAYA